MTPVLVDSNVILDIAERDPHWLPWSRAALRRAAEQAMLVINAIIHAEVAAGYATAEEVERLLPRGVFQRHHLPYEAAFLAGRSFVAYRRRGGLRTSPLPDFYIGAHAAVRGYRLLTRDPGRYRGHLPSVPLIAPEDGPQRVGG